MRKSAAENSRDRMLEDMVDLALSELENAMDALHKLNRETDVIDDVEYNKINRAIWDIEQILKERLDR
jgi:hypothetical protein